MNKELITKIDEYINPTNDLTREMDTYLIEKIKKLKHVGQTYLYDHPFGKHWPIRFPGATRGHIEVDENDIIQDIKLYTSGNTDGIYNFNVRDCFEKYIGMKLVVLKE